MKARLPKQNMGGAQNMNAMIRQAQKMQDEITTLQEDIENREFSATSGGGAVSVVVTGKPPTRPITIAERIIARNAWIFVFKTRIISKMIPIARPISILSPLNVPTIKNSSLNND